MKNRYEIRGETTVIFIERRNGDVYECLIDTEVLERVSSYTWCAAGNPMGAVHSYWKDGKYKSFAMHRLLTDAPKGLMVDHVNGNRFDNRKLNLRFATNQQNQQNIHKPARSSSGFRGVGWSKAREKWKVQVKYQGKSIHLGYFEDLEKAKRARLVWEKENFPYSNRLNMLEGI